MRPTNIQNIQILLYMHQFINKKGERAGEGSTSKGTSHGGVEALQHGEELLLLRKRGRKLVGCSWTRDHRRWSWWSIWSGSCPDPPWPREDTRRNCWIHNWFDSSSSRNTYLSSLINMPHNKRYKVNQ